MARPGIDYLALDAASGASSRQDGRRVLHLIPFLWSGAGDVVSRLAASQRKQCRVGMVTSGSSRGESDWDTYIERLAEAGVDHFKVDLFDRTPGVFWQSVDELRSIVGGFQPDIVHCHAGVPAAAAAAVRDTGSGFRLIGQLHSWGTNRPGWMNAMDLWAFGRCDRVISNAGAYRTLLRRSGIPPWRIVSIPWGLELDAIRNRSREPRRTPKSRAKLGFVGRIEPRKRQVELVEAFRVAGERGLDADLELIGPVGDPDYGMRVEETVRSSGLESRVKLMGRVPDVYSHVEDWDVFVSLSSDEGQGMAVLEAMALGVPVIAADAPGIRDYLRDLGNGFVVPSVAPADVADTIEWVFDHPGETAEVRRRAQSMIEERYRWDKTVADLDGLYAAIV